MAEYIPRDQAARYLRDHFGFKISAQTLAVYACRSRDPLYRLARRNFVYEIPSLDVWAEERLSPIVRSTAEMRGTAQRWKPFRAIPSERPSPARAIVRPAKRIDAGNRNVKGNQNA